MISLADRGSVIFVETDGPAGASEVSGSGGAALGVSADPDGSDQTPVGGRQRRVQGGRGRRVEVRLTDEEYDGLARRAAVAGVSVPRFLVECGLDPSGPSPGEKRAKFATFMAVRRTLAGAATNLNQLAKWANTEQQWPQEAGDAADAVAVAAAQVEVAIKDLDR